MSKRRRSVEHYDLINVLKQKQRHDPLEKQKQGQETFALMMRAASTLTPIPSATLSEIQHSFQCFRCPASFSSSCCCSYCEHLTCQQCIQQCQHCEGMFCTACSIIDYSSDIERVYCLTCLTAAS